MGGVAGARALPALRPGDDGGREPHVGRDLQPRGRRRGRLPGHGRGERAAGVEPERGVVSVDDATRGVAAARDEFKSAMLETAITGLPKTAIDFILAMSEIRFFSPDEKT